MLFTELIFFGFFIVTFALYWATPRLLVRKIILIIASYVFYSAWDYRFLSLIIASTLVDYVAARKIHGETRPAYRKLFLAISVMFNLGLLGVFKYFDFFAESLADLLVALGFSANYSSLNIILPVGISFYTFQTMSYTIDVYRGKLQPRRSLVDVALFVGFFPQLVAGPIVRAAHFLPQLDSKRRFADVNYSLYIAIFAVGFFKKAVVSDNVAPLVDLVFSDPYAYDTPSIFAAVALFAVQIYCDFSGYSEMAIATGGLLGFRLPKNFDAPYLAANISDFWRRWHISLSSWLRDYLYISLGGNRRGRLMTYRNLMLTMLLGGLWHGASWNFLVWGGVHGAALALHKAMKELPLFAIGFKCLENSFVWRVLGIAATFYLTCFAWVFFRADDLATTRYMASVLLGAGTAGDLQLPLEFCAALLGGLYLLHILFRMTDIERRIEIAHPFGVICASWCVLLLSLTLAPLGYRPFIYFQF